MSKKHIDADAAKLAGLQIDMLQKLRNGHMTLGQLERFNKLSFDDREKLFGDGNLTYQKPAEKFSLLADLGTITVPDDYVHENRLATFRNQNSKKFYYYNDNITDANFPNPSRILKPGDKLRVRVFQQIVRGNTSSEERMAFLATQNAIHLGAQGASIVFEQKRDQLPKGRWYTSFDEKERLWKDSDGNRRVPLVHADSDGDFEFDLGCFEGDWNDDYAFFCFCDE